MLILICPNCSHPGDADYDPCCCYCGAALTPDDDDDDGQDDENWYHDRWWDEPDEFPEPYAHYDLDRSAAPPHNQGSEQTRADPPLVPPGRPR